MNAYRNIRRTQLAVAAALALALVLGGLGWASPAAAAATLAGTVNAPIGLNLRTGPGLTHRVQVVLEHAQALELLGRSANSQWLEVRLPDSGLGGWVFAAYVKAAGGVSSLPITEGAGGPTSDAGDRPPSAASYSLYMTIAGNQGVVTLQKYPANAEVVVKLGRTTADLTVATGVTDANGAARIVFDMPARWADGTPLSSGSLTLTAAAVDSRFSRSATIVYVR